METLCNRILLRGELSARPEFSHIGGNENYYRFPLTACRLSGKADVINVIIRESDMREAEISDGDRICVSGEVRSYNNRSGEGSRLVIHVLSRDICTDFGEDDNEVTLCGVVCKPPAFRKTPLGRRICDLMLAVPRRTGRSDYIPVIVWGRTAFEASELFVGDPVRVEGRLQSREYRKITENGAEKRTAFEVSASELTRLYED